MKNVILNPTFRQKGTPSNLSSTRPPMVAITGGIACGKSTLGRILTSMGAEVVDTDEMVHQLQRPGQPIAIAVEKAFGSECILPDGSVDRPALASLVFHDPNQLQKLNSLCHPLIRSRVADWCEEPSHAWLKACLIPLLFETGWESDWDWTLCIACSPETQFERLMGRGHSAEEARQRIAAQAPLEEKKARADIVICNDGTLDDLQHSVASLQEFLQDFISPTLHDSHR